MEDEVDGADGWTTDTDSIDEEEEMDDDEANEDEFGGFPPPTFPIIDPDEHGMNFSEEALEDRDSIEEFQEIMGNLHGQIFDQMPEDEDEEDDDDDEHDHRHHNHNWLSLGRTHTLRHGGRFLVITLLTPGGLQFRGGLFGDDHRRNISQRSCITFFLLTNFTFSFACRATCNDQYPSYDGERTGSTSTTFNT